MNKPVAYRSFAEFFDRRFRGDARSFVSSPFMMAAFAEARYFGWEELRPDQHFPIKGVSLDAKSILGNEQQAKSFSGGPVILARLSPMDYHHVHYPDDGKTISQDKYGGRLWTVNRNALQSMREILFRNERQVQILETANFGRLGFVEVGALSVGRIVQVHPIEAPFRRGEGKVGLQIWWIRDRALRRTRSVASG